LFVVLFFFLCSYVNNSAFFNALAVEVLTSALLYYNDDDSERAIRWKTVRNGVEIAFDKQNDRHLPFSSKQSDNNINERRNFSSRYIVPRRVFPRNITHNDDSPSLAVLLLYSYPLHLSYPFHVANHDVFYYSNFPPEIATFAYSSVLESFLYVYRYNNDKDGEEEIRQRMRESFFNQINDNCNPPFRVFYEVKNNSGNPFFLTNYGGFLQSFVSGFLGLRYKHGHALLSYPLLPPFLLPFVRSLTFRSVVYSNCSIRIILTKENIAFQLNYGRHDGVKCVICEENERCVVLTTIADKAIFKNNQVFTLKNSGSE